MPTLLKALVEERGQTFASFSREYARTAQDVARIESDPSISNAIAVELSFRRWTNGKVQTVNYPAGLILEEMYGHPVQALLSEYDPTVLTQPPSVPQLNESELVMTARDAAAHAGEAASHTLPEMALDQLCDDVAACARAYSATSPVDLFRRAKELLTVAQTMADRTHVPRQQHRAYVAAGQAAALLSAITFDLGSIAPAVQLARTSALYGQVTEHGPLQAYAQGTLAFLSYWDGRPSEAVRHVNSAKQFGGLGDTAHARLAVIEARAFGHLGNTEAARTAIRSGQELESGDRDELHDDIGGEFGFTTERRAMSNATTYLLLRDADGAEESAERALELLEGQPSEARPKLVAVQAAIDLGRARLMHRDVDGAQEAMAPAFATPSEWRQAGMLERMAAARTQLTHPDFHGSPAATSLAEQIEDFSTAAAARKLGGASPLALER